MQRILISIFGVKIQIASEWAEMVNIISKDFWSFRDLSGDNRFDISIQIKQTDERPTFPESVTSMQTQSALTYDNGRIRYCDYYGKAASVIDFKNEEATVFGTNFDKVHEIVYLMVLSRAGKLLDIRGHHKLHAFAVGFKDMAFVCMMPSKGGKSTLLVELLKDSRIKMISDDIPLINWKGEVLPFLLKIGLNEIPADLNVLNKEENIYSMKRELHGEKILVCTKGIEEKLVDNGQIFSRIILAEAFRFNSTQSKILPSSWRKTFKGLFKHGIIGIGSPIIIEYFWESGLSDFILKTWIFCRRFIAFLTLSLRSKRVMIYAGTSPAATSKEILRFLESQK